MPTAIDPYANTPGVSPLPYQPAFEQLEEGEAETITELEKVFFGMATDAAEAEGVAHRAVHAKGHALLRGRLQVLPLPPQFAQGIFAAPATFEALLRFSSPPAEQLPDDVSTPRALALKVMGVPGERVPESARHSTQDFLMVNGPVFSRPGPKGFLRDVKLLAATTEKAPGAKKVLSAVMRGTEAVIEALGGESAKLKSMGGQPRTHPLAETYFSQVPFLYGSYMAKFSLVPVAASMKALETERLDGDDAQRDAIREFFGTSGGAPAEWELRVQLCTDIEKMPIEDASVEWDIALSPYFSVARLVVPQQQSWQTGEAELGGDAEATSSARLEQELSFDPWHAVAAHRPLGALNRARKAVMAVSRSFRSGFNRCPIHEPPQLAPTNHDSPGTLA